jgi:hypothetical protein
VVSGFSNICSSVNCPNLKQKTRKHKQINKQTNKLSKKQNKTKQTNKIKQNQSNKTKQNKTKPSKAQGNFRVNSRRFSTHTTG